MSDKLQFVADVLPEESIGFIQEFFVAERRVNLARPFKAGNDS